MGWRFYWRLHIERDDKPPRDGEFSSRGWPRLFRWAIVGLAVLGAAAFLITRELLK